jgi:hypothetical protein
MGEVAERGQLPGPQLDRAKDLALDYDLAGDHVAGFPDLGSEGWAGQPAHR